MNYKNQTFEEFLQEFHFNLYSMILDDDLSDHYNNWISELEVENMIEIAELYGRNQYLNGKYKMLKMMNKKDNDFRLNEEEFIENL